MSQERGAGDDLGARGEDSVLMCSWNLWLRGETSESFNCLLKAGNFRRFVMPKQGAFLWDVLKRWLSRC